ncbi:MAG: ketopantoate reductase family protein, partial [Burkholderiales bacterium]
MFNISRMIDGLMRAARCAKWKGVCVFMFNLLRPSGLVKEFFHPPFDEATEIFRLFAQRKARIFELRDQRACEKIRIQYKETFMNIPHSDTAPASRPHAAPQRIGIVGSGAIGGHFAARLARAGHTVSMLARGRTLEAIA